MVAVADDLGGADIGEIEWVEEEDHVFAFEVGKFEFLEGVVGKDS